MTTSIEPKLGEGFYLAKDVAHILRLDYQKTYRWMVGYWGLQGGLNEDVKYTFGGQERAINFYSLIEFYTFFKLRENGVSAQKIRQAHNELSRLYNTPYPFAKIRDFRIEPRKNRTGDYVKKFLYYQDGQSLIKLDGKQQVIFNGFIDRFLRKIEFDDNSRLASKFFPLDNSRNVVVDPNHQFGQPTVFNTNIRIDTLYNLHLGGESVDFIARLYDLSIAQVRDAIAFSKAA